MCITLKIGKIYNELSCFIGNLGTIIPCVSICNYYCEISGWFSINVNFLSKWERYGRTKDSGRRELSGDYAEDQTCI